jgi:MFS family permease
MATGQNNLGRNYKWHVVAMLWFICFFNYADRQAISAVFPVLKSEFQFTDSQLGLIGSAFMWVYAFGAPVAGFICDRYKRKNLILGGCLFWSCVTVLTGSCAKLWQFITVRALEGLGETFYFPASMSLLSDYHDQRTRSRAFSFHQSSVYAGTILGSWLGAWFAETLGWRVGFYFFGGAGMVLALVLWRFLLEPQRGQADAALISNPSETPSLPSLQSALNTPQLEEKPSLGDTLAAVFASPAVALLMLAFAGANFVAAIFLVWAPTFLVEKFGFKLASAGLNGTVFIHLASAASVPVAGALADRLARRFPGGRMLVQGLGLAVGAAFVFLVGNTESKSTLLVAMTIFGACKGFYDSGIFASVYDAIEPRARGSAAGLMNTVGWLGGALGPLYVGYFSQYGGRPTAMENMSHAISYAGVIYLVSAGLVFAAMWRFRTGNIRTSPSQE